MSDPTDMTRRCHYVFTGTKNRCGAEPKHPVHIYGEWPGPEEYHAFAATRAADPLDVSCEKCGATDIYTHWLDAAESKWDRTPYEHRDNLAEHLCRTCRTCGYAWDDPVLAARLRDKEETRHE